MRLFFAIFVFLTSYTLLSGQSHKITINYSISELGKDTLCLTNSILKIESDLEFLKEFTVASCCGSIQIYLPAGVFSIFCQNNKTVKGTIPRYPLPDRTTIDLSSLQNDTTIHLDFNLEYFTGGDDQQQSLPSISFPKNKSLAPIESFPALDSLVEIMNKYDYIILGMYPEVVSDEHISMGYKRMHYIREYLIQAGIIEDRLVCADIMLKPEADTAKVIFSPVGEYIPPALRKKYKHLLDE